MVQATRASACSKAHITVDRVGVVVSKNERCADKLLVAMIPCASILGDMPDGNANEAADATEA
jgi:hypothetical protein